MLQGENVCYEATMSTFMNDLDCIWEVQRVRSIPLRPDRLRAWDRTLATVDYVPASAGKDEPEITERVARLGAAMDACHGPWPYTRTMLDRAGLGAAAAHGQGAERSLGRNMRKLCGGTPKLGLSDRDIANRIHELSIETARTTSH
jgi:hypothetical protein